MALDTAQFVKETTDMGFGGSNLDINRRLSNTFNQWSRGKNDECSYVNEMRILRKPLKYYTASYWSPSPNNGEDFVTFTPVGNQKSYYVSSNFTYPQIGEPTSLKNRKYIQNVEPLSTSPNLGSNAINASYIDVNSTFLENGIGALTNTRDNYKAQLSETFYENQFDFVDANLVQNPKNIIFADGLIPVGGLPSRQQLQNFAQLNNC